MGGYLKTSEAVEHTSYGVYEEYKNVWYKFAITVSITSAGAVTYSIKSTNNVESIKGWLGCQTSAWIEINGQTVLNTGYYGGQYSTDFPWGNGSVKSGSAGTTTSGSVTVKTKIIPGSSYSGWPDAWNDSLSSSTIERTKWTDVKKGKVEFTDNYNNSFTVKGYRGDDGTNNDATGAKLWWATSKKADGEWNYSTEDFAANKTTHSKTITFTPSGDAKTRPDIAAAVTTTAQYGNNSSGYASDTGWITPPTAITQYVAPENPGSITTHVKNGRATLRSPWTFKWDPAEAGNDSAPVKGYRIRLYRTRNGTTSQVKTTSNTYYIDNDFYYDSDTDTLLSGYDFGTEDDSDKLFFKIDPTVLTTEFKVGDTIWINIFAYSRFGKNNDGVIATGDKNHLFSGNSDKAVVSDYMTIQNAGIVHVKVGGSWKEGQVYVKINGSWKEAETIQTKVNGSWKESQ